MFLDKPYVVFAQALADSMLLHVAKHAVFEELGPSPFARRMIAGLARRLHGLVRDVEAYTLHSGEERFIGYLLAELPEGAANGAAEVNLTPGKSVLASRLNMTPEHFSRILHELTVAFKIGILLYIPFIIVDMVVASVLMSMGMIMLPPVQISMPFKLILFILVDGWGLLTQQLFNSFL